MKYDRFDLEQLILKNWEIVTEIKHLRELISDGKHGCKIFGYYTRERDYDQKKNRPNIRLMTEVYKVSQLYLELKDCIDDRHVEVHLDINPSVNHASNIVVHQAIGYIRGTCDVEALIKPNAFAASYAADRLKFILNR